MVRITGHSNGYCRLLSIHLFMLCFTIFLARCPETNAMAAMKKSSGKGESYVLSCHPGELIVKFKSDIRFNHQNRGEAALQNPVDSLFNIYCVSDVIPLFPSETSESNQPKKSKAHLHSLSNVYKLILACPEHSENLLAALSKLSVVVYVEPNYFHHACAKSAALPVIKPWVGEKIQLTSEYFPHESKSSVLISIIDTGIDTKDAELIPLLWENENEIASNGADDDENGYIDDLNGWDFVSVDSAFTSSGEDCKPPDNLPDDGDGHGSLMARIVANTIRNGAADKAIQAHFRLMPLRAGFRTANSRCLFKTDDCATAIYYAAKNRAQLILLAWNSPYYSRLLDDVIAHAERAGCTILAAAGNENHHALQYPAALSGVWAIAGTDEEDKKASFSNYGDWITLSAPGSSVLGETGDKSQRVFQGTSVSAAIATGIAALVRLSSPDESPDEFEKRLVCSAENIESSNIDLNGLLGAGRINYRRAMLNIRQPNLILKSSRLQDLNTDFSINSAPIDKKELVLTFQNIAAAAESVSLELNTNSAEITCFNPQLSLGSVAYLDSISNAPQPFLLGVSDEYQTGISAICSVTVSDTSGFTNVFPVAVTFGEPPLPDVPAQDQVDAQQLPRRHRGSSQSIHFTCDFDGDAFPDLVCSKIDSLSKNESSLAILFNDNNASFNEMPLLNTAPRDVKIGDIDGNGLPDLVVLDAASNLRMLLNDGQRNFRTLEMRALQSASAKQLLLADIDLDGDLDVILNGEQLLLLRQDERLAFSACDTLLAESIAAFKCSDLNGDAFPDIIGTSREKGEFVIVLNDQCGHFTAHDTEIESGGILYFTTALSNNDQFPDLLVLRSTPDRTTELAVYHNDGTSNFSVSQRLALPKVSQVVIDDFDSDGDIDLAAGNSDTTACTLLNDNTGTFELTRSRANRYSSLAIGANGLSTAPESGSKKISEYRPRVSANYERPAAQGVPPVELAATRDSTRVKLSWQAGNANTDRDASGNPYWQIRVGSESDKSDIHSPVPIVSHESGSRLPFTYLTHLTSGKRYYWSVRGIDLSGRVSEWADENVFEFRNSPPRIGFIFPPNDTTLDEGDSLKFHLEAHDIESDSLYIVWKTTSQPDSIEIGTGFLYVPGYHSPRKDTIQATISDGDTTIAHFWELAINNVNLPPEIAGFAPASDTTISEGDSLAISMDVLNPDNDSLSFRWFVNGRLDSTAVDSAYLFCPDFDDAGVDSIRATISDGDTSISQFWCIAIKNRNRLPEISNLFPPADSAIFQGDSLRFQFAANDPDGDSLRYFWFIDDYCDSSQTDTCFLLVSDSSSVGIDTVKVVIADADSFSSFQWLITVNKVNHPPVILTASPAVDSLRILEGDSVRISLGAADSNGDSLAFNWFYASAIGDTIGADSIFWLAPDFYSAGVDTLLAAVSDGDTSIIRNWTLRIINVNQPPQILSAVPQTDRAVIAGDSIQLRLRTFDPDSEHLDIIWIVNGRHDTTATDSTLIFRTEPDSVGNDTIICYVSDRETTIFHTWCLHVRELNHCPEFVELFPQGDTSLVEGDTLIFKVVARDVDDDSLFYQWRISSAADSASLDSQFVFMPDFEAAGIDTISGIVFDGDTLISARWIVTIANRNRAPEPPELLSPLYDQRISEFDWIAWKPRDPDVEDTTFTFHLDIAIDSAFQRIVSCDSSLKKAGIRLKYISGFDSLLSGNRYYWRISAIDAHGDTSGFGPDYESFIFFQPSVILSRQQVQLNEDRSVSLYWETEYEHENAGFNIHRAVSPEGSFTQINATLIRGNHTYSYDDHEVKGGITYYYRLENVDLSGRKFMHPTISIETPAPEKFELYQNFPNPFNVDTVIRYQIPRDSHILLTVHNILGRVVRTLVDENQKAGFYNAYWDGKDNQGRDVGSGIYFYNIYADNFHQTKKLIVVR
ncbi:VCBS repeat-containing protein [candidate division KSB1 bacterium]|nr:VCBS repeat-containing protein [candidate division KSB1 bacterium]